jgi:hypothetical protein
MTDLTELQLKLLEYYKQYYKEHKRWPRIVEAANHFKTDHRHISGRVYTLASKGYMNKLYDGMFEVTRKK